MNVNPCPFPLYLKASGSVLLLKLVWLHWYIVPRGRKMWTWSLSRIYIPGICMCILNCKIISSYNRWSEPSRPDITSDNPYWSASTIKCLPFYHKDAAEKGRVAYIKINDAEYADFQSNCFLH